MIAYKLLRVRKNGSLGSLFINRKAVLPLNKWILAQSFPTKGFSFNPKWHALPFPDAPHLSMKGRAWYKVEIEGVTEVIKPFHQGGRWYLANYLKIIGAHNVRTNDKNFNRSKE